MMNSELPKLRLDTELYNKVMKTLEGINKNEQGIKIKPPEFRRMALQFFCNDIAVNGLDLKFKLY